MGQFKAKKPSEQNLGDRSSGRKKIFHSVDLPSLLPMELQLTVRALYNRRRGSEEACSRHRAYLVESPKLNPCGHKMVNVRLSQTVAMPLLWDLSLSIHYLLDGSCSQCRPALRRPMQFC